MKIQKCKELIFKTLNDSRGQLTFLEEGQGLPFELKRVYYLYNVSDEVQRGVHAHKKLEQIIICLSGKCELTIDDGKKRKVIQLNNPSKGIYICPMIWRELDNFSEDAVLLVLASTKYDPNDYIHEYNEFLNLIK